MLEAITHAVIAKRTIYGRKETGFAEGENAIFEVRLNCTTLQSNSTGFSCRRIQFNLEG
jgi:hypothetical protein